MKMPDSDVLKLLVSFPSGVLCSFFATELKRWRDERMVRRAIYAEIAYCFGRICEHTEVRAGGSDLDGLVKNSARDMRNSAFEYAAKSGILYRYKDHEFIISCHRAIDQIKDTESSASHEDKASVMRNAYEIMRSPGSGAKKALKRALPVELRGHVK